MTLDAFAVTAGFLAVLESGLGAVAVAVGIREWRAAPRPAPSDRRPLLVLVAAAIAVLALASCPILYLLLASWVPRWPGVMCVEGVRRIGTATAGPSRWLPGLLAALDATKILLVFAAGAWAVLHRAGTGSARRAALAAALLGLVALVDGAVEVAYVAIPKEEVPASAGCCTISDRPAARDERFVAPPGAEGPAGARGLVAGLLGVSALLGAGAGFLRRRNRGAEAGAAGIGVLAVAAALSLPLAARFLADVAAPAVLGLPFHRCAWCAFERAPETVVGAALYLGGTLCAGWAFVARRWAAPGDGTTPAAVRPLLGAAGFGFLGAGAMAAVLVLLP